MLNDPIQFFTDDVIFSDLDKPQNANRCHYSKTVTSQRDKIRQPSVDKLCGRPRKAVEP